MSAGTRSGGGWTRHELAGGVRLHHWPTDKFKTLSVRVYLHAQLQPETVTVTALASQVLGRGCAAWPTLRELNRRLEALYGAELSTGVVKLGDLQSVYVALDLVLDRYLPAGAHVLEAACQLLRAVLREPAGLRDDVVGQEKDNLARRIQGLVNDKTRFATLRCVQEMFRGQPFALTALGREEDLEGLDAAAVRRRYDQICAQAPVAVFAVGGGPEVADSLAGGLGWEGRRPAEVKVGDPAPATGDAGPGRRVVERQAVNQGKLCLGYRTGVGLDDPLYAAMDVYNGILGGFPHSKLFRNVREKASLAYYASSRFEALKGILLVSSGIEPQKYDQALEIIERQVDDLRRGRVDDEELEFTRRGLANRLRASLDSPGALIDAAVEESLRGRGPVAVDERLRRLAAVGLEDVARAAGRVVQDTVYFLTSQEGDGDGAHADL